MDGNGAMADRDDDSPEAQNYVLELDHPLLDSDEAARSRTAVWSLILRVARSAWAWLGGAIKAIDEEGLRDPGLPDLRVFLVIATSALSFVGTERVVAQPKFLAWAGKLLLDMLGTNGKSKVLSHIDEDSTCDELFDQLNEIKLGVFQAADSV